MLNTHAFTCVTTVAIVAMWIDWSHHLGGKLGQPGEAEGEAARSLGVSWDRPGCDVR